MTRTWTPQELEFARNLLYYYGKPYGWEPGNFTTQLIRLIEAADTGNRLRVLSAFAYAMPAVQIMQHDGPDVLQRIISEHEQQASATE